MASLMALFGYRRCGVEFVIPIKTVGDLNRPAASWKGRMGQARRAKAQCEVARLKIHEVVGHDFERFQNVRFRITLTRVCPAKNQLRGSDNLQASMKHVRDGIAMALRGGKPGQKDDVDEWTYEQEGVKNGTDYFVKVSLEAQ